MHAPAAQDLGGLAQVGHRPVARSCRCRPGRSAGRRASSSGTTLPGRVRQRDERRQPRRGRSCTRCATSAPASVRSAVQARSVRPSRYAAIVSSAGKKPVSEPASTAMFATASRSSIDSASAPVADELEHHVRRRRRRRSRAITARIRSLPGDEAPLLARELDPDRARHRLPEAARRQAGGDVGRAEAGAERAERAVRARVRVAAGDHRARHDPAVLDEHACARSRRAPARRT